jgi:hypothetical protein
MDDDGFAARRRDRALGLLRELRRVDDRVGVKNSRIAFDIVLLFYETAIATPPGCLSVDQIASATDYSGPTVRLILKRLIDAGTVGLGRRVGKTQLYLLTPQGREGVGGYVKVVMDFPCC